MEPWGSHKVWRFGWLGLGAWADLTAFIMVSLEQPSFSSNPFTSCPDISSQVVVQGTFTSYLVICLFSMQPLLRLTEEVVSLGMRLSCGHTEACLSLNHKNFNQQFQVIIPGCSKYASVYSNRIRWLPNADQTWEVKSVTEMSRKLPV